jgi:hypothetical protein
LGELIANRRETVSWKARKEMKWRRRNWTDIDLIKFISVLIYGL